MLAGLQRPHQTYGMDGDNDYRIAELEERTWGSRFALCFDGQKLGEIECRSTEYTMSAMLLGPPH